MRLEIIAFVFVLLNVWGQILVVQGCHIGGLHKRSTGDTDDKVRVRSRFNSCFDQKTGQVWAGPVDFVVLHSQWYVEASAVCNPNTSTDTLECWLQEANKLVGRQSPNLRRLKECMIQYSFNETGTNYGGSFFPSNETASPDDNPQCPTITLQDFETAFINFYDSNLEDITDETFNEIERVLDVVQADLICTSCTCDELSNNLGLLEDYEFTSGLECGDCWSTRVASMAAGISPIVDTLALSAVQTAHLQPISTCPQEATDINGPNELLRRVSPRVTCKPEKVVIKLHRCAIVDLGLRLLKEFVIAAADGMISPPDVTQTCTPYFSTEGNKSDIIYEITNDLNQCGVALYENATHISYTYTMRTYEDNAHLTSTVRFTNDIRINVTCTYQRNYTISSDGIGALQSSIRIDAGRNVGAFDVVITLFQNSGFTMPIQPNAIISVPSEVYVDINIATNLNTLLLTADSCWISNNASAMSLGPYVYIYMLGCPMDSATSEVLVSPISTQDSRRLRFSFTSFTWVQMVEQKLFLHCEVSVCQISASNPDCQQPACNTKRKRSLDGDDMKSLDRVLTVGPVFLHMEKPGEIDCSKNNGGCSHFCATQKDHPSTCMCPKGMNLMEDGKSCVESNQDEVSTQEQNHSLLLFVLMFIGASVLAILHFCR